MAVNYGILRTLQGRPASYETGRFFIHFLIHLDNSVPHGKY